MSGVIVVTDVELEELLSEVSKAREAAERLEAAAKLQLARAATEALMAGWSLRQVADATGYSISTVRRVRLVEPAVKNEGEGPRPVGWYEAVTRPGMLQFFDGERWLRRFRDDPARTGPAPGRPALRLAVGEPRPAEGSAAELDAMLATAFSMRTAAEATAQLAHDLLARTGTEALMAGRSLRDVAAATGYSASTVQRHRIGEIGLRGGWYPARTRPDHEQRRGAGRWLLEFRRLNGDGRARENGDDARRRVEIEAGDRADEEQLEAGLDGSDGSDG